MSTPAARRWSKLIEEQAASGQTTRAFAAERGVNPRTLAWWRSKLKRAEEASPSTFVELRVAAAPAVPGTVDVELERYGARVLVDGDTDLSLLRRVLESLC
jgi:transposase-like protein